MSPTQLHPHKAPPCQPPLMTSGVSYPWQSKSHW